MRQCSVPFCESNFDSSLRDSVTFFNFPDSINEAELFNKWVVALQEQPEYFEDKEKCICSRHFRKEDFEYYQQLYLNTKSLPNCDVKLVLVKDAVPSLLLPNDDKNFLFLSKNEVDRDSDKDENSFAIVKKEKTDEDEYSDDSDSSNHMVVDEGVSNDSFPQYDIAMDKKLNIKDLNQELCTKDNKTTNHLPIANVLIKEELIIDDYSDSDEEEYSSTDSKVVSPNQCHTCFNYQRKICSLQENESKIEKLKIVSINFQNHLLVHYPPKKFACCKCDKKFAWHKDLKRHKILEHEGYKCEKCRKKFTGIGCLKSHKRIRHGIFQVYVCKICDKTFNHTREFDLHKKEHRIKTSATKCQKCKIKFENGMTAETHNCTRVECELCGKYFAGESYLNIHLKKFHSVEVTEDLDQLKCKICDTAYKNRKSLKIHLNKYHPPLKTS